MLSLGLLFQLWGFAACRRRSEKERTGSTQEPITILKPLKGADADLEENLRSFFQIEYPKFELLFAAESRHDPGAVVAARLIAEFPQVRARLVLGRAPPGIANPKVGNLWRIYRQARYEAVLISDSNVRIGPKDLTALATELAPGVGLVTSVVRGEGARTFAGELEAVYLNSFYAKGMLQADQLGKACVVGKAMLFRRETFERLGGLEVLGRYLAEDYMAGVAVQRLGLEVRVSREPVRQHIGEYRFSAFWQRHIRWGRIRKAQAPLAYLAEPLIMPAGVAALCASLGGGPGWIGGAIAALCALDLWTMHTGGARIRPRTLAAWIARESLAPILWAAIGVGNHVQWRGRRLNLKAGGLLENEALPPIWRDGVDLKHARYRLGKA